MNTSQNFYLRKPDWLKKKYSTNSDNLKLRGIINNNNLNTVCSSARCPNINECFNNCSTTFLLLGDICSRNCLFCNIKKGVPLYNSFSAEINNIVKLVREYNYKYVTVTSVTRDDLNDYGISCFCELVKKLNEMNVLTETLIPDLKNNQNLLYELIKTEPAVINHNIEMIERLYPDIRPNSDFNCSMALLEKIANSKKNIISKTGFMIGLGENETEILELIDIIADLNIDILTIGQYLQPSRKHYPIKKYYAPEEFNIFKKYAQQKISVVVAEPFVRSSYKAFEAYQIISAGKQR